VDGVGPWPGDDVGGPRCNLVVRGVGLGTPRHSTPDDVIPFPESLGAAGPGTTRLLLLHPPWLSVPAYRLGAGGGQRGVHVFACRRCK
jgi:hypothetical protein